MKQRTFVHSLAKGKSVDNGRTDISMPGQHNSHTKHCIRLRNIICLHLGVPSHVFSTEPHCPQSFALMSFAPNN